MKTSRLEPLYDINLTKDPYLYKVNNVNHKHGNDVSIGGPYLHDIDDVAYAPVRNSASSSTNCISAGHVHTNGDIGLSYNEDHFRIVDNKLEINLPYFLKHLTVNNGSGSGDYFPNKLVPISANSITGKAFTNWTVQTGQSSYIADPLANSTTFRMPWPPANCECTANYEDVKYVITVTHTVGGEVTPPTSSVIYNSNATFTITPDAHYHSSVLIDSVPIGSVSSYTFYNVLANHSIDVTFEINVCHVHYELGNGARSGGGAIDQYVPYSSCAEEPTVIANAGYVFTGWDRSSCSITDDVNTTIITAQYTRNQYRLIYSADSHGYIDGVAIQTGYYLDSGTAVTARPIDAVHYRFDAWSVVPTTSANRTDAFSLADQYFTATFSAVKYVLSVSGGVGGGTYSAGDVITVAATGLCERIVFGSWTIPAGTLASGSSSSSTIQYIMPAQDVTLTANTITKYLLLALNEKYPQRRFLSAGEHAFIEARNPINNETSFKEWIINQGIGSFVTNAVTCEYVMPACDSTIQATYNIAVLPTPHQLTVSNGTGSGSYVSGTSVSICANDPAIGKAFNIWSIVSGGGVVSSPSAVCTTYIMPDNDAAVAATYSDRIYALNTIDGKINGSTNSGSYVYNAQISVVADVIANNAFTSWTSNAGGSFANSLQATTTFIMPASNATITANHKLLPYLTVINGVASGYHSASEQVAIEANAPVVGKSFDYWASSVSVSYASPSSSTTTPTSIIMPNENLAMTANYKNNLWSLIVTNGTGSILNGCIYNNNYAISYNTPAAGKMFDKWTGDIAYLTSDTNVLMPNGNVSVTATYKDIPVVLYALTVTSGTGSGNYSAGTVVNISASAPASGKVFDKWTGDVVLSSTSSSTSITMPAKNAAVTATYKDEYVNIIVRSGHDVTVQCGSQSAVGVGSSFILHAIIGQTYSFWVSNAAEAWWWASSAANCTGANRGSNIYQQGFSITMNSNTLNTIQIYGANIFVGS